MGKIKQGILGGFNGTTGSVVGASWKGIAYMRGKAQSIKNPRTLDQQANRNLFGMISDLASKANSIAKIGFASKAVKQSAYNALVKANMRNYAGSVEPYDLEGIVFSDGNLNPILSSVLSVAGSTATITNQVPNGLPEGTKMCSVVVIKGLFKGSPMVLADMNALTSGNTQVIQNITLPSGVDYSVAHGYSFVYNEDIKDASITTFAGSVERA